jgi:hypothetical protein
MFEAICIRNQNEGKNPIDIGFLAEALLFYQQVRIIGNDSAVEQLVKQCGAETLIELLKGGFLKISYQTMNAAMQTLNTNSPNEIHSPIFFSAPRLALQNVAPKVFTEVTGRSGKGRRLGNRFIALVDSIPKTDTIGRAFEEDLSLENYINKAVVKFLSIHVPEYQIPQPFEFRIIKQEKGYSVRTNIDFPRVNYFYHKRVSVTHSTLTPAYILARLFGVQENLFFSSLYSAELAVSSESSFLLQTKINDVLDRRKSSREQISSFQDFIFNNGYKLREAINAGEKSFADLLKLLDKATKFKSWLKNQKPDENLCKNYLREATASTWIEKLPAKSMRWPLFTGAGIAADSIGAGGIGTAIGVGLSAADAFLVDKIINGWKPNHFINDHLVKFLNETER